MAKRLNEDFPTKTIDKSKFPNPLTKTKGFLTKGKRDGSDTDDIINAKKSTAPASKLKPSQDAIYLGKTIGMAANGIAGGDLGAIISSDNYILDGHHRWASTMMNDPTKSVTGVRVYLSIGDLIPVLRATGDAMNNPRGTDQSSDDISIFKATIADIERMVNTGKGIPPQFYNKEKYVKWFNSIGKSALASRLKMIQKIKPPSVAPARKDMPKIDPPQVNILQRLLQKGKIDVKAPYANESKNYYTIGGDRYDGGVDVSVFVNNKKVYDDWTAGSNDWIYKGKKYFDLNKMLNQIARDNKLDSYKDFKRVEESTIDESKFNDLVKRLAKKFNISVKKVEELIAKAYYSDNPFNEKGMAKLAKKHPVAQSILSVSEEQEEAVRTLIRQALMELFDESDDIEEATTTANVAGFDGKFGFSKRGFGMRRKNKNGGATHTKEGGHPNPAVLGYTLVEGESKECACGGTGECQCLTVNEAKHEIYHTSYTSALNAAIQVAQSKGFEVDEDDWWTKISVGPRKPGPGKTNKAIIRLTKNGKPNNSTLSIQVYNRGVSGKTYELNCYVNVSTRKVKESLFMYESFDKEQFKEFYKNSLDKFSISSIDDLKTEAEKASFKEYVKRNFQVTTKLKEAMAEFTVLTESSSYSVFSQKSDLSDDYNKKLASALEKQYPRDNFWIYGATLWVRRNYNNWNLFDVNDMSVADVMKKLGSMSLFKESLQESYSLSDLTNLFKLAKDRTGKTIKQYEDLLNKKFGGWIPPHIAELIDKSSNVQAFIKNYSRAKNQGFLNYHIEGLQESEKSMGTVQGHKYRIERFRNTATKDRDNFKYYILDNGKWEQIKSNPKLKDAILDDYYKKESLQEGRNGAYYQLKNNEEMNDRQKIGIGLRKVYHMLGEINRIVALHSRLKSETGTSFNDMWKRTQKSFIKIEKRLNKISSKIRELKA